MSGKAEQLRIRLEEAFRPTHLTVEDESWKHAGHAGAKEQGGGHFTVEIVSDQFADKSRIERHRIVNKAVAPLFGPTIHALTIRAQTPEEAR